MSLEFRAAHGESHVQSGAELLSTAPRAATSRIRNRAGALEAAEPPPDPVAEHPRPGACRREGRGRGARLEVYPAHFAGSACGAGISGKPSTTLAFERRFNPLLALDREAFIAAVAEVPPKPAEMDEIMRANRGRAGTAA